MHGADEVNAESLDTCCDLCDSLAREGEAWMGGGPCARSGSHPVPLSIPFKVFNRRAPAAVSGLSLAALSVGHSAGQGLPQSVHKA